MYELTVSDREFFNTVTVLDDYGNIFYAFLMLNLERIPIKLSMKLCLCFAMLCKKKKKVKEKKEVSRHRRC